MESIKLREALNLVCNFTNRLLSFYPEYHDLIWSRWIHMWSASQLIFPAISAQGIKMADSPWETYFNHSQTYRGILRLDGW